MMTLNLSNLKPKIKKPPKKRVGRGGSSGHGNYSGRGMKGQKARTGGRIRPGFEGGRMPLIRQIPKRRGFKSFHPKAQTVRLAAILEAFKTEGQTVSPQSLFLKRLLKKPNLPVKIVGSKVKVSKKLNFEKVKLSRGAEASLGTKEAE